MLSQKPISEMPESSHKGRWAIHKYGEAVQWTTGKERDDYAAFESAMLPPLQERAALICLDAGDGSSMDDGGLDRAIMNLAERLWRHHDLDGP